MYIYMWLSMIVYNYMCIYDYMSIYIYVYDYIHDYIYMIIWLCIYIYLIIYNWLYIYAYMYISWTCFKRIVCASVIFSMNLLLHKLVSRHCAESQGIPRCSKNRAAWCCLGWTAPVLCQSWSAGRAGGPDTALCGNLVSVEK